MKIKIFTCLFLQLILSYQLLAQDSMIQNIMGRKTISLNGRWNYIIDPYENGYYNYRHQPYDQTGSGTGGYFDDKKPSKTALVEYDFDQSPTLKVPGDWNSQEEKLLFYEGTVWYRKKFSIQPIEGKRYFLYFGAVNYEAHVYLNGHKLGMHKGGFTPFSFEITGKLHEGENFIVVKADNTRKPDEIPTVNTDWWNYGGLTRDVLIAEMPGSFIQDYTLQLSKTDPGRIEGYARLSSGGEKTNSVLVSIPEVGINRQVVVDAEGWARFSIPVKNLKLWTPEQPRLYDVTFRTVTDSVHDRIGFRTISTKGQDILLNGKPVFLRGISMHDENPLIAGRLRGEGDIRMMLQWAKDLHCNYVRLAHYPHNEEMVRLADEMGLMVWAEVPVYWTISWDNPETYKNASKQLTDMIMRDRNRASVIIWSVGNETPLSASRLKFMTGLAQQARTLDSTRLVAAALEVHMNGKEIIVDDPLGQQLDLVSFNEYAGWYWGNLKELGPYNFTIQYNKPVIVTEFGGDALAGYHADEETRWSEEYQEALYKVNLQLLTKIKGLRGMTPWILTDFRSPRRPHPVYQNYWNRKGLISETGKKKKAFYVLRSFYDQMAAQYH